jgi:hypothetical protein
VIGRQYQGKSVERELPRCASTRYGEVNSSVSDREFAAAQPLRRIKQWTDRRASV